MKHSSFLLAITLLFASCGNNKFSHDASGTFEATEIILSSEVQGKVKELNIQEGDWLEKGQYLGYIDTTQLYLKKLQLETAIKALKAGKPSVEIQIASLREQLVKAEREYDRVLRLYKGGAATEKQLDDAKAQADVLQKSIDAQNSMLSKSVGSLDEEINTYKIQVEQVEDMLAKSRIYSPVDGRVLNKYIEASELAGAGTPLFKIADTRNLFIRIYVVGAQLEGIKLGQDVKVFTNESIKKSQYYRGAVAWISDKAEFTPKTIQTKDERENLVYAVKVAVKNADGLLKIGMYGDVNF
ncbi:MAG: HlyD family efflux transporter periplasmic adaptor subunit [Prevotellaceae bacterium]|jgi:HlyD family secretion protein|nr:HlyD family efflux transporter periplasmic adaptor subunit [Prevotellaceae bacterium]